MSTEITVTESCVTDESQTHWLLDRTNPRALINLITPGFRQYIEKIPKDYLQMSERELRPVTFAASATDERLLNRLRIGFWHEYNRIQDNQLAVMKLSNIYSGVCSAPYFYNRICDLPHFLAWIVNPPADYLRAMEDLLSMTTSRLEEIIISPINPVICRCHYGCRCSAYQKIRGAAENRKCACKPKCLCPPKFDAKVAMAIIEAHKILEMRVHGAIVQRIRQESLNVSINKNISQPANPQIEAPRSAEEIAERIKELEKAHAGRLAPALNTAQPEVLEAELVDGGE